MMKPRAENPLLWYQLFGLTRNRWRRQPLLYGALVASAALTYLLVFQLIAYNDASLGTALNFGLFAICLFAPLMAYNLFSLEYEKQTWESLALTRLSAREILWGKWGAALVRLALLTLAFVPMTLITIDLVGTQVYATVAGWLVLFSWGALLTTLGMWLSFKLKRTISTASTLYAGQVFALLLFPLLYLTFGSWDTGIQSISFLQNHWEGFLWWVGSLFDARFVVHLNPFYVNSQLGWIAQERPWTGWSDDTVSYLKGLYYLNWGYTQSFLYLALAMLFAGLTYRGLKYAWRK
ncbi:MAG: ABC transporter permease [Fimbriimonadales bacterium]|nr:ABC transporter permease [Fimbriimonadales bacterium]